MSTEDNISFSGRKNLKDNYYSWYAIAKEFAALLADIQNKQQEAQAALSAATMYFAKRMEPGLRKEFLLLCGSFNEDELDGWALKRIESLDYNR